MRVWHNSAVDCIRVILAQLSCPTQHLSILPRRGRSGGIARREGWTDVVGAPRRKAVGVLPNRRRNRVAKCWLDEKPQARATSKTERSGCSRKRVAACCRRHSIKKRSGVNPVSRLTWAVNWVTPRRHSRAISCSRHCRSAQARSLRRRSRKTSTASRESSHEQGGCPG